MQLRDQIRSFFALLLVKYLFLCLKLFGLIFLNLFLVLSFFVDLSLALCHQNFAHFFLLFFEISLKFSFFLSTCGLDLLLSFFLARTLISITSNMCLRLLLLFWIITIIIIVLFLLFLFFFIFTFTAFYDLLFDSLKWINLTLSIRHVTFLFVVNEWWQVRWCGNTWLVCLTW